MTPKQDAKMVLDKTQIIKKPGKFVITVDGRIQHTLTNREMLEIANWVIGRIAFDLK